MYSFTSLILWSNILLVIADIDDAYFHGFDTYSCLQSKKNMRL
ncbi:hypothetical protein GcC1_c13001o36 [Golovinomyces cichoracearum]|uniref:Uncharacterized protein n=1 Tax=Golovinomyces cichoracearum TaxID=62708 RepID=A0A420J458_9PEZI|nr:hypothetical protein GcC1_c13001o36 [Golovinomyces cichoracearum]